MLFAAPFHKQGRNIFMKDIPQSWYFSLGSNCNSKVCDITARPRCISTLTVRQLAGCPCRPSRHSALYIHVRGGGREARGWSCWGRWNGPVAVQDHPGHTQTHDEKRGTGWTIRGSNMKQKQDSRSQGSIIGAFWKVTMATLLNNLHVTSHYSSPQHYYHHYYYFVLTVTGVVILLMLSLLLLLLPSLSKCQVMNELLSLLVVLWQGKRSHSCMAQTPMWCEYRHTLKLMSLWHTRMC